MDRETEKRLLDARDVGERLRAEFETDFEKMMATIAAVSLKHKLPNPTVIFPYGWRPRWQSTGMVGYNPSAGSRQHCGVKFAFGELKTDTVTIFEGN